MAKNIEKPTEAMIDRMVELSLKWSDACRFNSKIMEEYGNEEGRKRWILENWNNERVLESKVLW